MKRIDHIFFFSLFSSLLLSSCVSEDPDKGLLDTGDQISFIADIPGISTRANYKMDAEIVDKGITVSAITDEVGDGHLPVFFEDQVVVREVDGEFRSDGARWPVNDKDKISGKDKNGYLKFFAYHPPRQVMRTLAGVGDTCFIYSNSSIKSSSGVNYDYRLNKFRVIPDISKQVDFITSIGEGNKTEHLYSGIKLNFEHQLCGVNISVWGGSTLYDVEIAGVRIGGTVVEADFGLSTVVGNPGKDENTIGTWFITPESMRGHVDYVFSAEDQVVCINANEHNAKDKYASIMGNGGNAMVIPFKHDMWDHTNDKGNKANGMYFSALIRMTEREGDNHVIFPSTDPESMPYLVFLLVNKSDGKVNRRLSAEEYKSLTPPEGFEKRAYGWAAVPVKVDWKPGYTYSYVLDYSRGVGVHDPADPNPASPVVNWEGVEVSVGNTSQWGFGETIKVGDWGANSNNTAEDGTVWWK